MVRRRLTQRVFEATVGRVLLGCYLVHGPRDRLDLDPSADVANALFNTVSGRIVVGAHAFFGHNVSILTGTHDLGLDGLERQRRVPRAGRDIVIGREVWVASGAMVLGPCRIGDRAVVAAGAVVTRDVPDGVVVAGVPARPVAALAR